MYKFIKSIRVRTCGELSFLVNINDNSFFVIKTKTLEFLELKLSGSLTPEAVKNYGESFADFIEELEKQNILEVA